MPIQILFWGIYILSIFFGGWTYYSGNAMNYRGFGGYFAIWVLVGLLGWHVFGSAVK